MRSRAQRQRAVGSGLASAAACLALLPLCLPLAAQQTCSAARDLSLPTLRFHDNGDGTVTDLDSKLMWMRCSGGQQWRDGRCAGRAAAYSWPQARQDAERVNREAAAFFNDWRLPALRELATITDRACQNPRTNLAVFPGTAAAPYWTATPRTGEHAGERAWTLSFGADGVALADAGERLHVRYVRTGP